MTGIPQSRRLWITPLSPVHMGTDEDYTPTGYVIEDDALYEFNEQALENLPDIERRKLNNILNRKASPDMLKQVQAFFYNNRERLIPAAVNVLPVSDEMASLYKARVGKAANIESGGKQVLNALEIERAAYNPADRRLLLPGTGLKGAIRTALLNAVNRGQRAERGEPNRDLQQRLFGYTMRDLHKDPMRLVQVGDCAWHGGETLNSAEALFAVNRKKRSVMKDGRELNSQAEQQNLYQLLECATPFRFRAFRGLLNIPQLNGLGKGSRDLPKHCFSFGEVAKACNDFYRPKFEQEIEMLKGRGMLDSGWRETVETLLADPEIRKRLDSNDAFLLRVGRHSGAESVTLDGVRSIKIMKGRGQKPGWYPETKTIWLATGDKADKRHLKPFGWLLVELTELDETPPDWQSAQNLIESQNESMSNWLNKIRQYQNGLNEKLNLEREKSEQQARAAAERAAKEAQRKEEEARLKAEQEAARQAELARMNPMEREIAEFDTIANAIRALENGQWEGEALQHAAEYLKQRMLKEGSWREKSAKKRPEKDKPYQQTLAVMKRLG